MSDDWTLLIFLSGQLHFFSYGPLMGLVENKSKDMFLLHCLIMSEISKEGEIEFEDYDIVSDSQNIVISSCQQ